MGKVSINISGSTASIGNVVQGDGNKVSARQENAQPFTVASQQLAECGQDAKVDPAQIALLLQELEALRSRVDAGEDETRLGARLKRLAGQFSWATPVLKALAEKILPKLVAIIFA